MICLHDCHLFLLLVPLVSTEREMTMESNLEDSICSLRRAPWLFAVISRSFDLSEARGWWVGTWAVFLLSSFAIALPSISCCKEKATQALQHLKPALLPSGGLRLLESDVRASPLALSLSLLLLDAWHGISMVTPELENTGYRGRYENPHHMPVVRDDKATFVTTKPCHSRMLFVRHFTQGQWRVRGARPSTLDYPCLLRHRVLCVMGKA